MRKNQAPKRKIIADPVYGSELVTKAINMVMLDGKRGLAQNILYTAFEKAEKKLKKPAIEIFNQALENIMPTLELKVRRIAGSNYQVPTEVGPERKKTLGLR
jgi:small subunit ribosomal protein S7